MWFKPDSAEAHNNLGLVLLASGKARESIPEFEAALRLKPELKVAADNLHCAQAAIEFATGNGNRAMSPRVMSRSHLALLKSWC